MAYIELIGMLAVLQFFFFGFMTGVARGKAGLKAPAISGDERFERIYRVHVNTLEMLAAFLPSLFIAGKHWSPVVVAVFGLIYLIGRFVYWRAYISNPDKRRFGFMLSMLPTLALIIMAIGGAIMAMQ
ncbi:MAG: hypothetical protein CSA42_06840 [Gammaproteobacteria bacterium]|nr:MAG: hypothetical protein CSA42_06840 [Gammaproteobacteria bacterium]